MLPDSRTMIALPCDGNDDFLDVCTRLWLAQDGEPSLLVIDTFGRLDGNPKLKARLIEHPRVELASLNLKIIPTAAVHPSDPCAFAHDYALSRCPSRFLLATHVDVFPLHRGVVQFMEREAETCPVVGWGMSPRGPEAVKAIERGEPPPAVCPYSDGVMGMVCTIYDVASLDRVGASWSIRRGHHEFGLPRCATQFGWPDTETTFSHIMRKHCLQMRFLGRETNNENQETEHWLHSRSARLGIEDRHREALARGLALAEEWGV